MEEASLYASKSYSTLSVAAQKKAIEAYKKAEEAIDRLDALPQPAVRDDRKALVDTVRKTLLYAGSASHAMQQEALAALDRIVALQKVHGIGEGVIDDRAWPFR